MIGEDDLALMISTAYSMPYISVDDTYTLDGKEVFELINMYTDEVEEYIRSRKIKTLSLKILQEEVYILCDDTLYYVGTFEGGYIPSQHIHKLKIDYEDFCGRIVVMHTHPVPLPIPSPEDIISMQQIGYDVECILSRTDFNTAKMICIQLLGEHKYANIISDIERMADITYKLVDRYVVVKEDDDIRFIPYPSNRSLQKIEEEFIKIMKRYTKINIALLDMDKNEYYGYSFP